MNMFRVNTINGIKNFINTNMVVQANVSFIQKMLTQPIGRDEEFSPYTMFNAPDNKEVSLTYFVDDNSQEYVCLQILKLDEELTESEVVGLWYWPVDQIQIACYRYLELVENDGIPLGQYSDAMSHNEITGEPVVIHEELDEPEEDTSEDLTKPVEN